MLLCPSDFQIHPCLSLLKIWPPEAPQVSVGKLGATCELWRIATTLIFLQWETVWVRLHFGNVLIVQFYLRLRDGHGRDVGKMRKVGKRKMWKKLSAWFDYPPIRANIVWRGHSIEDESHISQQRLLFCHLSDLFFTEEILEWRCQNFNVFALFPRGENKYYYLHLFSTFQTNQMRLNLLIFDVSLYFHCLTNSFENSPGI